MTLHRRTALIAAASTAILLAGCSTGQTTSSSPSSGSTSAPSAGNAPSTSAMSSGAMSSGAMSSGAMSSAMTSAPGGSGAAGGSGPAAIKAAGGTSVLTGTLPAGVEAQYGPLCKGSDLGIAKIDLKKDTIGWAQSEKEANPFRIASTKSEVDQAKKLGVKLLTTNAQSDAQQENTDIKGMIDKGAKAVIFSPINSTGLGDAIAYAKSKKVAMIPVDRNITGVKGCQEVGPQLGSDFVQQGKRAADAMIKATGGKAKLAILLGASGVNVTDDRTAGFKAELKAKNATGIEIIFEQTADFTREKGKSVTETLLQAPRTSRPSTRRTMRWVWARWLRWTTRACLAPARCTSSRSTAPRALSRRSSTETSMPSSNPIPPTGRPPSPHSTRMSTVPGHRPSPSPRTTSTTRAMPRPRSPVVRRTDLSSSASSIDPATAVVATKGLCQR